MDLIIDIFLTLLTIYFLIGLFFGLFFLFGGALKIDPLMKGSKWIVRLLLFPGCLAVWPFLIIKLIRTKKVSDEQEPA